MNSSHNRRKTDYFENIAGRYDLLNHIFSFGLDLRWRDVIAADICAKGFSNILDTCTGTADMPIRIIRKCRSARIVGTDISEQMLIIGNRKVRASNEQDSIKLIQADTLDLPFNDNRFDVVTICFGLRNIGDRAKAVREMLRVIRPNGRLYILEFAPRIGGPMKWFYTAYLRFGIPMIGGIISGSFSAYRYLASSVASFLRPEQIVSLLREKGATGVRARGFTYGIVYLFTCKKSSSSTSPSTPLQQRS